MKSSTDIWFITFLKMEGYEYNDYEIISKNKGRFFYDIDDKTWKELKIKCDRSDISKIKTIQTSIKDLIH